MSEEKYAKSPLLYVEQPGINEPKARMQRQYRSYGKDRHTEQKQQSEAPASDVKPADTRPIKRFPLRQSPLARQPEADESTDYETIQKDEQPDVQSREASDDTQEDKPFKAMTIEEKVSYLVDRSPHAPVLRCEVTTTERSYRGVLMDNQDNEVSMQVGRRSSTTSIPLADIQNIRLLGLM